jgi:hypothetical protein
MFPTFISFRNSPKGKGTPQARANVNEQNLQYFQKEHTMAKERNAKKEEKKKPAMTQKEKKAAKKSKNETSDFTIGDKKK